jgi:DNA gyrase subunit B
MNTASLGGAAVPTNAYDADQITILSGLEAVRQRPGMYIGSTGIEGLHHLVYEVVDNAIDESLAGHCDQLTVELLPDGSCAITDNGRGIPVGPMPDGRSAAEVVLTTLHTGAKFHNDVYKVSGGLHGVGVSCVNALSERLELDVWRSGAHFRATFSRGTVTAPITRVADSAQRGTRVCFLPDARIFRDVLDFSWDVLSWRLRELAFLNPGLSITFRDLRGEPLEEVFLYAGGTQSFVAHLNRARIPLHAPPIHIHQSVSGVEIDLALQWTSLYAEDTHSFVNSIRTAEGGTHLEGLRDALTETVQQLARDRGRRGVERIRRIDVREGLACVLSLKVPQPEFGGQTKTRLTNPAIRGLVCETVREHLRVALESEPALAAAIIQKALDAARARRASRRAGDASRHQLTPEDATPEIYQNQFGERSKNWHDSAVWIAHDELLSRHGALSQVPPDSEALDVCCGSGVVGASFRGRVKKITGLDITPEMVTLARERLDEVVHGTVYDIPFPNDRFELVCNREVMHLMPDPMRMMSEVVRVLKPGGQFVVGQILPFSEADAAWMFRIFKKKQPLLYHMFQEEDFESLLRKAGLVDIEMHEFCVWEDIDVWIDTYETSTLHRYEIRRLYQEAPAEVRAVHPFKILPSGRIQDCWRWCIYSARKPGTLRD